MSVHKTIDISNFSMKINSEPNYIDPHKGNPIPRSLPNYLHFINQSNIILQYILSIHLPFLCPKKKPIQHPPDTKKVYFSTTSRAYRGPFSTWLAAQGIRWPDSPQSGFRPSRPNGQSVGISSTVALKREIYYWIGWIQLCYDNSFNLFLLYVNGN